MVLGAVMYLPGCVIRPQPAQPPYQAPAPPAHPHDAYATPSHAEPEDPWPAEATPDTTAPDTAAPDTAAPDTTAPDTATPDTAGPPSTTRPRQSGTVTFTIPGRDENMVYEGYRLWLLAPDLASAGLTIYGAATDNPTALWVGAGGLVLAPSVIHLLHGQSQRVPWSVGFRAAVPAVGGLLGAGAGWLLGRMYTFDYCCGPLETPTDEEQAENDRIHRQALIIFAVLGAATGAGFALLVDYGQSEKPVARRAPTAPAQSARFTPVIMPTTGGASMGVLGRF